MTSSLCVYLCDRSGQRGQVWPSARFGHSKRDRTEQAIFSKPLWLNSLFSHQSPWNCSVSLYERHPDGTVGSKLNKQIAGSRGWGSVGEAWEYKCNPRPRKSSWKENLFVCLVEFWLTCGHTSPGQIEITLTSVLFMLICCCLLKSNTDGAGSNVVVLSTLYGVRDLPSTLLWASLATGCDLAQQVKLLSDSPQVLFTTGGSQGQRTWLYFKFRLNVLRAKLLRTHCLEYYDDYWGGWPGITAKHTLCYVTYPAAWQKNIINCYIVSWCCSIGIQ